MLAFNIQTARRPKITAKKYEIAEKKTEKGEDQRSCH
jgi:hypothetical protein